MGLLDGADWQGKILKGGKWQSAGGGDYGVVEPATGAELGRMGQATADDVREAALSAREAQHEWAALPHTTRSAVLRRAGDLWAEHAEEITWWNVREVGAVPGMAGFALHVAAEECYAAAALPGLAMGELLPSEQPRLPVWSPSSRRSTSRSSSASARSRRRWRSATPCCSSPTRARR